MGPRNLAVGSHDARAVVRRSTSSCFIVKTDTILEVEPFVEASGARIQLWPYLAVSVLAAVLATLYAGILRDLFWDWWNDPNYTHGFLVPLFTALLVWQRRQDLRTLQVR